ncbi:hypothetical protein [Papillibacter cinnamivorans]|uniref:Uncharacterized protein n=1 Tax=Papillibacter cinnamivorans DSM 12816 TaxID=1122930 RepID=A0A1W2D3L9_9FIRM|nr:hypothetical protein [Papillibacter cinnamivorans]SMC92120.1 hypothetical protein SAMN02745168_0334 [Papillibacter cinnamivorans DSM 12816]
MRKHYGKKTGRRRAPSRNGLVKWIAGFAMLNGAIWLFMSYVLAYCGTESLRALCVTLAAEVIGAAAVYQIKAPLEGPDQRRERDGAVNKRKEDEKDEEE